METQLSYAFPKSFHLCSKKEIDNLFAQGKTFSSGPFKVFYLLDNPQPAPLQVIFAVPKRAHKRAVHRNLIRRRMRESFRLQYPTLLAPALAKNPSGMAVLCLYLPHEVFTYQQLEPKMRQVMARLASLVDKAAESAVSSVD